MEDNITLVIRCLDNGDGNIETVVSGTYDDLMVVLDAYTKKIYEWYEYNFGTGYGTYDSYIMEGEIKPGYGKYGSGDLYIEWDIVEPMSAEEAINFIDTLEL